MGARFRRFRRSEARRPRYRRGMARGDGTDGLLARAQERLDAERSNALGPLRDAAGRRASDQERAMRLAADNLLDKALRRLAADDDEGARRLVDRALGLTLEGSAPGAEGALAVHLFVWDALREATARDGWLDRAETVTAALPDAARREWLAALDALAAEGEVPGAAVRRIRALGRPGRAEPFDGVAHEDRVGATTALLRGLLQVTA